MILKNKKTLILLLGLFFGCPNLSQAGDRCRPLFTTEDNSAKISENPLDHYFHYLSQGRKRFPLLSQDKIDTLIREYKRVGDTEIRNKIVSHNLGLVIRLARQYHWALSSTIDRMDLIQAGNKGLIDAVEAYKPELRTRFSSLAVKYIEGYIKRFLFEQAHIVRIKFSPEHTKVFFNLEKQKDYFFLKGEIFNADLVAKNLNNGRTTVKPETVSWMSSHLQDTISFNQPVQGARHSNGLIEEDANLERVQDFEEVYRAESPFLDDVVGARMILEALIRNINDFLSKLTPREQGVFIKRFLTSYPVSQNVLAETYGVSVQRIRQIERKLRMRFKHRVNWQGMGSKQIQTDFFSARFIGLINSYTESSFGKSFDEYFSSFVTFSNKEVLDFVQNSLRSVLPGLSSSEKEAFYTWFHEKTYGYRDVKQTKEMPESVVYKLRDKVMASLEDSQSISRFKAHVSVISDFELKTFFTGMVEIRAKNIIDFFFPHIIYNKEAVHFFEKTLRSILPELPFLERNIVDNLGYNLKRGHDNFIQQIEKVPEWLINKLRDKIMASPEDSQPISRFKAHVSAISDFELKIIFVETVKQHSFSL